MLGHRALNVEDYIAILKRRWWLIVVPALIFPILAVVITFVIPPRFVSQTLVLIDQQKVPDDFVKSVVSQDLDNRLASMKEQILSRSSIQPIIEKYGLYSNQKMTMDARIEQARNNIKITPIHSEIAGSNGLPGFYISFEASDAQTAQQVCREITSLFTGANIKTREAAAEGTTQFLKEQLDAAKRTLDDQDAKLAAFQRDNFGKLPGDDAGNQSMLTTLSSQLDAKTQSIQTLDQQKTYTEAMLAQQSAQQPVVAAPGQASSESLQTQQVELDKLLATETDLKLHYTPDYPEVKTVGRKIADLRAQMAKATAAAAAPAPTVSASSAPSHADSLAVQQLRAQLRSIEQVLQARHTEQEDLQKQMRSYTARVQSTPQVEEEYKDLTRDAQTSQTFYDSLLAKMEQSQMATDLEHRQEGEQFRLMDDANLPDSPIWPKKSVFAGGGFALGFGIGLLISALLEYKNTALRSERDIWAFTQLPTLAVIAWSGDVAEVKLRKRDRLKRLFSRKSPKEMLADGPG